MKADHALTLRAVPCAVLLALTGCSRGPTAYESPEAAASAFIDALERDDPGRLTKIFGSGAEHLIKSGDAVADSAERERFLRLYDESNSLERAGDVAYLNVGMAEWPFPIPIVKRQQGWMFDAPLGEREVVARRIGRNEISAVRVSLAYVDAQLEYARMPREHAGYLEYAQRLVSTAGKRDGLYWPTEDGEASSPIGPLVAAAQLEGYELPASDDGKNSSKPRPYHGYYYRILKAQGANAVDGAYNYVVNDHMIGGFALIAYPANYGNTGVMSFVVNHRGVVYEKDLGENTAAQAAAMNLFDPDATWRPVADQVVISADMDP